MDGYPENHGHPRILEAGMTAGSFPPLSAPVRFSTESRAEVPPPIETKGSRSLELGSLELGSLELGIHPCSIQSLNPEGPEGISRIGSLID